MVKSMNQMISAAKVGPVTAAELTLLYQPQVSADGKTIVCVEALLRRNDPYRGRLSPSEFMPLFDTPALLEELDWWVLQRACEDSRRWPGLQVSVNVTATQFRHPDFAERALATIQDSGVSPHQIELEIVEASFIEDAAAATRNITTLRDAGVKIALDDFGTGYSSLTYLLQIPLDKLKIDKGFIDRIETVQSAAIVQSIVALARSIGLKVTAEGVESEAQHKFLRAVGCHYMQGYLFSAAASVDGISRMLASQQPTVRPL
jgi:EAL domain-containing protein (putative c-di-GMP-specific phosphodiesterase class I)